MEGLKVIEKSYNTLLKFKNAIYNDSITTANSLAINMSQFDLETQSKIKETLRDIVTIYKEELEIDNVSKALSTNNITIEFPDNVEGFKDDLIDALKDTINKRSAELYSIILSSNSEGGIYSV